MYFVRFLLDNYRILKINVILLKIINKKKKKKKKETNVQA
jgi:hypothetical protein